jgi:hypothetical protein
LPDNAEDQSKFLIERDIKALSESLMNMLAGFKHRGAIEITADSFELFCKKLLNSDTYSSLPRTML